MARGRHDPARYRACFALRRGDGRREDLAGASLEGESSARPAPPAAAAPRGGRRPAGAAGCRAALFAFAPLPRNGVGDEGCGVAVRARACVRAAQGAWPAFGRLGSRARKAAPRAAGLAGAAGAVAPGGAAPARCLACRRLSFQGFGGFRLLQAALATPPRSFIPAGLRTRAPDAAGSEAACVQSRGQPVDALLGHT
jgi:hypothetical protein